MTRAALLALISHWWRNPLQLVMLLVGLALATALWSGVQALNAEARAAYSTAEGLLSDGGTARLEHASGQMDQAEFARLRRAGWHVSPVIEGRAALGTGRVTVLGIDPLSTEAGMGAALAASDLEGFFNGLGYAHPQTLAEIGPTDQPLRATQAVPVGTVLFDIATAQTLLGADGWITRLSLAASQPDGLQPLETLAPGLRLIAPDDGAELAGLTDSFHLNLTAFGLLAFAVGLFIVHSAVGLAFEQRRAMFRTLRALGLPLRHLTACLAGEMVLFALVAGAAGLAMGYLLAAALLPDVALTLRGLYGAPVPGRLQFDPLWALAGLGMTLAGTALAGAQALWRLWHMPVLAPAQPRAWAHASARMMRLQGAAALALAGLAGVLALTGSGLVAGFSLLAATLLAAALAVPLVLSALLAVAERMARGPVAQWFWADSRQNLPRLSLALMALMLALSANIGVGTMVASFRATFIDWLDLRLVAEVNVLPRSPSEAEALHAFLTPRADAILPMQRIDATLGGQPAQVYAMKDHATFRDNWPLIAPVANVWDRLAAGDGVLVNEQLYRRAGLRPGTSTLDLPGIGPLPVLGAYPDYGNPLAQAVLSQERFIAAYPDTPIRQFALRTSDAPALIAALQDDFGLPATQITDQAQAKALSLSIFERTFLITRALNVLTLSVAALALFAALVTLSGMRLAQLAPLWALGLTPRHLAALELARALVLGLLTMVFALPVGVLLAQVLLSVINVQAFGWRLPMQVFPADWARLGLWASVAVLAAAAVPALRLWRKGAAQLLRVFAYER
ncbi:putative ABC transport system permease protein [Roseinatronobacter thiooxidans]|uniref:Putative ABC transport system permease protein n=1 Tax=Roseinatronobacter thiooxidans TaxID=121821 RepID=A0A2W7QD38_9RHOB|nr:FtsX-like permease family protein [Roseinatronobacter thiooxidans]PZX46131.1 putative ABC transport system permease protein [Roseinatronobacter thiooxidans]